MKFLPDVTLGLLARSSPKSEKSLKILYPAVCSWTSDTMRSLLGVIELPQDFAVNQIPVHIVRPLEDNSEQSHSNQEINIEDVPKIRIKKNRGLKAKERSKMRALMFRLAKSGA